ncbi:MAG: aspartate-semialdehyde dehydrogenase [Candidatus Omnitrophica bacterium]|jgi:aspartate-semialdehyde dehydrogenase|nr:aspartate-semialdehyde dehydrogenase [Candidatus Omnitrophota bacterium]
MKKYNVAVVGATGLVGTQMLNTLEKRMFPVKTLRPLASARSAGKKIRFNKANIVVELLTEDAFGGIDIVLSSAGADISRKFLPYAVKSGAVCIDNTSAFRMDEDVPLVVPEVNPADVFKHKGIIANPNCSTIQMVAVLKPLHDYAKIKRIVVSTYQAVSGAGNKGLIQLEKETAMIGNKKSPRLNKNYRPGKFPYQIAYNLIPHIDVFLDNGYTKEEMKMVNETRKILHDKSIGVTATCVRVPVFVSHSESVNIETFRPLSADKARRILSKSDGIKVIDNPGQLKYPMPVNAAESYETYVGRIRRDESIKNGLNLWIVSDNLLKGAALNAVQIAEVLVKKR